MAAKKSRGPARGSGTDETPAVFIGGRRFDAPEALIEALADLVMAELEAKGQLGNGESKETETTGQRKHDGAA